MYQLDSTSAKQLTSLETSGARYESDLYSLSYTRSYAQYYRRAGKRMKNQVAYVYYIGKLVIVPPALRYTFTSGLRRDDDVRAARDTRVYYYIGVDVYTYIPIYLSRRKARLLRPRSRES